jgi:kynurenine formamidase
MARRGIAGRAVLLDYGRWALKNNPEFNPFKRTEITVQELDQVAEAQGVTFEHGDILLVRIGWMEAYERYGDDVKDHIDDMVNPSCAGVKACQETFKWIWDHHFAAVGSDNFPFEAFPPEDWATSCRKYYYKYEFVHKYTKKGLCFRLCFPWRLWYAYW